MGRLRSRIENRQEGFILPMILIGLALGSLVVLTLLSYTGAAARAGGQDTDQVLALYASQAGLTDVITDLMGGEDALADSYQVPTTTVNDIGLAISVVPPVPASQPDPVYQYFDPGAGFGMSSLGTQSHYYFRVDNVQPGSGIRVNWAFTPPYQRWKIRLFEGAGPADAPDPVVIAEDDFESGTFTGGTGWPGDWSASPEASIVSTDGPHEGTYHLRLTHDTGLAKRVVDLSGQTDVRIRFWAKADNFEAGETATLSVNTVDDDPTYTVVRLWENGEDDNVYRFEDIDLSPFATSSTLWIKFAANMSGAGDFLFLDALEMVSQALPTPIAEYADTRGPGALLVDGSLIAGGTYTFDFLNDSGTELVSNEFGTSGDENETWAYAQAHKGYIVSSTADGSTVTAYVRQVPGPTEPVTGQRIYIESWLPYATGPAVYDDADGDGIEDMVDGRFIGGTLADDSLAFSSGFTDEHLGGTSSGTVDDRGGLVVIVRDAPDPLGFLLGASGGAGAAAITACGNVMQLVDGDFVTVTC